MADLEDTLNSILADPEAMGQIMALAGKLGLDGGAPEEAEETVQEAEEDGLSRDVPAGTGDAGGGGDFSPLFDPAQLGQLTRLLSLFRQGPDPQAQALLDALRPYLRPERQAKLDRAKQVAGLSRAARQAWRLWKEGELHL